MTCCAVYAVYTIFVSYVFTATIRTAGWFKNRTFKVKLSLKLRIINLLGNIMFLNWVEHAGYNHDYIETATSLSSLDIPTFDFVFIQ